LGTANATATAKSAIARAGVRSTDEASVSDTATANAVAQAAGSGQTFVTPDDAGYAFSTILPDKADVATLIGDASNVADALLGPRDTIFGTAILGALSGFASSTFDFAYGGDLLLGLVDGGGEFSITINGVQLLAEDFVDDSVINLGSNFGPNIDLTIVTYGLGDFAIGGAVPESSTWAMMLIGFAGLGFAACRRSAKGRGALPSADDPAQAWLCAPACSTRIAVSIFSSPPLWAVRVIAPSWPSKPTATRT
jgi:hypothetical protein